jgi:transposase InsO family protein
MDMGHYEVERNEREDDALAKNLMHEACQREGILSKQLTIHADIGGVIRSRTVSDLMITLGVNRSHSRSHCSNDNPYSESQFKTMKYTPDYPKRFDGFDHAQEFCRQFFDVYNFSTHHSGIAMLTPALGSPRASAGGDRETISSVGRSTKNSSGAVRQRIAKAPSTI